MFSAAAAFGRVLLPSHPPRRLSYLLAMYVSINNCVCHYCSHVLCFSLPHSLYMGYIPKIQNISHACVLDQLLSSERYMNYLLDFNNQGISPSININLYKEFVKELYCTKRKCDGTKLTFKEVRKMTMLKQRSTTSTMPGITNKLSHPDRWMPPESALERMAQLLNLQLQYMVTAGQHDAPRPDFISQDCLNKTSTGQVEYDFGGESKLSVDEISTLTGTDKTPVKQRSKRISAKTPQSGRRKKKMAMMPKSQSTPLKE